MIWSLRSSVIRVTQAGYGLEKVSFLEPNESTRIDPKSVLSQKDCSSNDSESDR